MKILHLILALAAFLSSAIAADKPIESLTAAEQDAFRGYIKAASWDVQGEADLINSQAFCAKKIAGWTTGGGGTAAPLRGLLFGDSLCTGFERGPRMALAGYIGLGRASVSGTVTGLTGRFDLWTNGNATEYAVSSSAELTVNGSATGDIRGDRALVAYIKRSGGGSFDLEYRANNTGSWIKLATISTSNASTIGAVDTYNLPTTNAPYYRLRVTNVTGSSVILVTTGIYNSNGGGVIWMPVCNQAGHDVTESVTTPSAVFTPIWTELAPDFVITCWADAASNWDSGGAFRTFYASATSAFASTDWIVVSANPSNPETGRPEQRVSQRAWARETNHTWINGHSMFRDFATATARGFMADLTHLTALGQKFRNAHLWSQIPLGNWFLGADFAPTPGGKALQLVGASNPDASFLWVDRPLVTSTSFSVLATDWANDSSKKTTITQTGAAATFSVNANGMMVLEQGASSGGRPGSSGNYWGSTSNRWRTFVTGLSAASTTRTGAYTATQDDYLILCDATSAGFTVSLPSASAVGMTGKILVVKKIDASGNSITLDGFLSETIDGALTQTISVQWSPFAIMSNGTAWFKIN
jgi:hypothetical protein